MNTSSFSSSGHSASQASAGAFYSSRIHAEREALEHGSSAHCVGKLLRVKVLPSGWAVGRINTDYGELGVCGNALAGLTEKMSYEFNGHFESHKTFGLQIKVDSVALHVPDNSKGIEKFLTQNYKGIGKKAAEKIVRHFSSQAGGLRKFRQDLLSNPYAIDFSVAGIKRKTSMDCDGGLQTLIYMDIATRIGGVELGDKMLRKMASYLEEPVRNNNSPVEKAWSNLTNNPYALIRDLDGYAFKTADMVARKVGFDLKRHERVAALVTHAIAEGCNASGHSYLTRADFEKIIHAIDPEVDIDAALKAAVEQKEPMVMDHERYYTEPSHKAEVFLARNLFDRYKRPLRSQIFNGPDDDLDRAIDAAQAAIGFGLDASQHQAVFGLLTSFLPVHTITAGPGCGKTTIMEVVVQIMRDRKCLVNNPDTGCTEEKPYKIAFCAPTGKAAKVLNARVSRFGARATTIHSLLGVRGARKSDEEGADQGNTGMFTHNHWNRLDVQLLVVDETSMVDLALMHALLSALPDNAHVVFLGDPKQLPSVGPGSCLADLLKLPFDHHSLHITHRNDGGILEVVHMAGHGKVDFMPRKDVTFFEELPPATQQSIDAVLHIYKEALEQSKGDFSKVGLLIARRKGDAASPGWNSTYLNAVLREYYNPEQSRGVNPKNLEGKAHGMLGEKIYGTRLRVGDRVIIRKNLTIRKGEEADAPVEQVVNGDTGAIQDYQMQNQNLSTIDILLDDGRVVGIPATDADILDYAYAMTVHTAQGSEYERIIFICVNGHSSFVHRGIVFTAFSRAKKHLTVIGDHDTIHSVIARPAPHRNSHLVERFQRLVHQAA